MEGLPIKRTAFNPAIASGRELLLFGLTHGEAYSLALKVVRANELDSIEQLVDLILKEEG